MMFRFLYGRLARQGNHFGAVAGAMEKQLAPYAGSLVSAFVRAGKP